MMNDTFGPMYAQPLMRFDQHTQSWRTSLDTSLWDLPMLSLTLPASGLMRNGELFERPMLERPTSATDSSSLPTPRESMHKNQGGNDRGIGTSDDYNLETVAGRIATLPTPMTDSGRQSGECRDFGGDLLHGVTCENCKVVTLPTPHAGLGERGRDGVILNPKGQQDLQHTLAHLMPTPTVMDMGNNKTPEEWAAWKDQQRAKHNNGNGHGESLTQAAIAWGKYEPAIRRWEALTREVPEPTVPHKDKRRINPDFVEWMMGLPEGHVTGHGLSAAKELKMLGNGVVPQQARSAVTQLMERITQ